MTVLRASVDGLFSPKARKSPSFADWGSLLLDEILAAALLDRLLHHAEVISITGPSYCMKNRREAAQALKGGGHK